MSVLYRYYALDDEQAKLLNLAEKLGTKKVLEMLRLLDERQIQLDVLIESITTEKAPTDFQARLTSIEGKIKKIEDILFKEEGPPPAIYNITGFWFSSLKEIQSTIETIDKEKYSVFKSMWDALWSKRGTPQKPVPWEDPSFIDKFLPKNEMPKENELAWKLWKAGLNPRHVDWRVKFIKQEQFVEVVKDVFEKTEQGLKILDRNEEALLAFLQRQGFMKILEIIKENAGCDKKFIINKWIPWVNKTTGKNWKKPSWINPSMSCRLKFLQDLKYIKPEGRRYYLAEEAVKILSKA